MTSKLLQILDDNAQDFQYSGGQWTLSTLVQWYQATSNYPGFASSTEFGSFTLSFEGTSIAFVGNTPTNAFSQTATVSIDGGTPYTIAYSSTAPPPSYIQWYQSPTLSDGKHTITVGHLDGTSVDYALIEVGPNTPLAGKTIVVDNDDPTIQLSGNWARSVQEFNAGTLPDGFPLQNSTHRSSTPGDTITLRFTGTSASVYGIFNWANLGLLSVSYTLDGNVIPQSYPVSKASPQYLSGDDEAINFLYFSQDNLAAADHTLVINITAVQNQMFIFDYITYTPSFSSLATMPNLTSVPASATSSTSSTKSTTSTASSLPSSNASSGNGTNTKSVPAGAIAGGVVGGVVLLALLAFLVIWLRKRRSNMVQSTTALNDNNTPADYPSPQMGQLSPVRRGQSPGTVTPFQDIRSDTPNNYGFGSITDLKRERADFTSTPAVSILPLSATNGSTAPETETSPSHASLEIDSNQIGGPPAYDALSTYRRSTMPSPNR